MGHTDYHFEARGTAARVLTDTPSLLLRRSSKKRQLICQRPGSTNANSINTFAFGKLPKAKGLRRALDVAGRIAARRGTPSATLDVLNHPSGDCIPLLLSYPGQSVAAEIHDRMSAFLKPELDDLLEKWPLSRRVNRSKASADDASLGQGRGLISFQMGTAVELTKIDVAEAQLCAAIRLFFEDANPVPVHTLAAAAREILSTLGQKLNMDTFLDEVARWNGVSFKEELSKATHYVNFFKHADRDPSAVVAFSDQVNDPLLFCACRDLSRIAGGLPVNAQVFEAWFFATTVKRVSVGGVRWQEKVRRCIRLFPGVRTAKRSEQKQIALGVLRDALENPALQMTMKRTVDLPET